MKRGRRATVWVIRLSIFAALAYFLRPLYAPPAPTLPGSLGPSDFMSWKFHGDPNPLVCQTLTVFGDGRNTVLVTRALGDPDLPDVNSKWKISRDKTTGLTYFRNESLLSQENAKQLLLSALKAGAIDLRPEPAPPTEQLEIQTFFAGSVRTATGPQSISTPADCRPEVWINRMRWQRVGALVGDDPNLRNILEKKLVTLVNDDGSPVKR